MRLSVILAIGRRDESIARVLNACAAQQLDHDDYEVVIVDRTPGEYYRREIASISSTSGATFVYRSTEDWSLAKANNLGIDAASNDVLLFLGEDFIPTPSLFSGHLEFHRARPEVNRALIGFASRTNETETDLTRWAERVVAPFHPPQSADMDDISPMDTSFANTSLKRDLLLEFGRFDEEFAGEGFEDIELAIRLHGNGLRTSFDERLAVIHDHETTIRDMALRWRLTARGARVFDRKHPGLRPNIEPQNAYLSPRETRIECLESWVKGFPGGDIEARERYFLKRLELAFLKGYQDKPERVSFPYNIERAHG